MEDRVAMVPRHVGYNILPNTPLFSRLLRFANRNPVHTAIVDARTSRQRTYLGLLSDILTLREAIINAADPGTIEALEERGEVYIAIVAAGGYEYMVAMLAILALGAAAVPITPALPVEEAAYFVERSKAALMLVSSFDLENCCKLEKRIASTSNKHFCGVPIASCTFTPCLDPTDILISSDRPLEEDAPAVVIFTSGTTGPPKGAVMRRAFVFHCALSVADHYRLSEDDVMLHVLPVHHATGVGIGIFPFLMSGSRIEFRSGGFDEVWMWERWKQGAVDSRRRLTFFSGVPTIYMRMRRYYQRTISKLPSEELARYIAGARQFRACLCGTSALPQPLNDFWASLMRRNIVQRYGATEFGAIFMVRIDDKNVPDGSVGELVSGVDVVLSEGDQGEVLVKSPYMFSKYLNDPEATAQAHDSDGYFRTGDLARREGKYFWILGRLSLDIIKSGGYKISALDVEREMLALPYISEAIVVGVPCEEFGQKVAAVISLQEEDITEEFLETYGNIDHLLTIGDLRRDLANGIAGYKMPTLLRIVDGELPKTITGKVQKKILGPQLFPVPGYQTISQVQQWVSSRELAKL